MSGAGTTEARHTPPGSLCDPLSGAREPRPNPPSPAHHDTERWGAVRFPGQNPPKGDTLGSGESTLEPKTKCKGASPEKGTGVTRALDAGPRG